VVTGKELREETRLVADRASGGNPVSRGTYQLRHDNATVVQICPSLSASRKVLFRVGVGVKTWLIRQASHRLGIAANALPTLGLGPILLGLIIIVRISQLFDRSGFCHFVNYTFSGNNSPPLRRLHVATAKHRRVLHKVEMESPPLIEQNPSV